MSAVGLAGIAFALAATGTIAFQLALALGAPLGAYAMGGAFPGRFPPALRIAALVQAAVIALLAIAVLSRAGLAVPALARDLPWAAWAAVVFAALSLGLNAASRSAVERRTWVPVALVMLVSSLIVALGPA